MGSVFRARRPTLLWTLHTTSPLSRAGAGVQWALGLVSEDTDMSFGSGLAAAPFPPGKGSPQWLPPMPAIHGLGAALSTAGRPVPGRS